MQEPREAALQRSIDSLGHDFSGPLRQGGDYVPVQRDGCTAYVSGQVPRVGQTVVVTGRVGAEVSLEQARHAARVCAVRSLLLLREALGGLDAIQQVLRVGVFVKSAEGFSQQSEVADAASVLLKEVLGDAGSHARTAVGVYELPKNAAVELEMVVRTRDPAG